MADEKKHFGHGGARPGAGRPRTYSKLMAFRLQKEVAEYVEQHPNKTRFVQSCIIRNMVAEGSRQLEKLGDLVPASDLKPLSLPMVDMNIVAGMPVPLDNKQYAHDTNLLEALCPHPESCVMIKVHGESMIDAGIFSGDTIIVDRSNCEPSANEVAVCELNGEYTLKRVEHDGDHGFLVPANPSFPRIEIRSNDDFRIWGVVTYIIHKPR